MGRVDGRVVLITGAARGQGRSHAVRLAEEGADIIALDMCADIETNEYPLATPEDLAETVRLVEKHGRRVIPVQADVRDLPNLKRVVADAVAEMGSLHAVSANAGICPLGKHLPPQAFVDVVDVNLAGVTNTISATLSHLPEGGSIILTGSVASYLSGTVDRNGPGGIGYRFAKNTLVSLVKSLAMTVAPQRIRVNAVHPTNVDTGLLNSTPLYRAFADPTIDLPTLEDAEPGMVSIHPMGLPFIDALDISNAVLYLVSDESRYVTGQNIAVDLGMLLGV